MPLYDFTCEECKHRHENLVHFKIKIVPCPKCNGLARREFPGPLILTSDRRSADMAFDPVTGKQMDKYEQDHWKNQPWPSSSDHAKKRGVVGKTTDE